MNWMEVFEITIPEKFEPDDFPLISYAVGVALESHLQWMLVDERSLVRIEVHMEMTSSMAVVVLL